MKIYNVYTELDLTFRVKGYCTIFRQKIGISLCLVEFKASKGMIIATRTIEFPLFVLLPTSYSWVLRNNKYNYRK